MTRAHRVLYNPCGLWDNKLNGALPVFVFAEKFSMGTICGVGTIFGPT